MRLILACWTMLYAVMESAAGSLELGAYIMYSNHERWRTNKAYQMGIAKITRESHPSLNFNGEHVYSIEWADRAYQPASWTDGRVHVDELLVDHCYRFDFEKLKAEKQEAAAEKFNKQRERMKTIDQQIVAFKVKHPESYKEKQEFEKLIREANSMILWDERLKGELCEDTQKELYSSEPSKEQETSEASKAEKNLLMVIAGFLLFIN